MLYYPRTKSESGSVKNPRMAKLKRTVSLGPGTHNPNMTVIERKNPGYSFSKTVNKNYVDIYRKMKSFVPGVGKYKEIDKGIAALGRPVTMGSSMKRRH